MDSSKMGAFWKDLLRWVGTQKARDANNWSPLIISCHFAPPSPSQCASPARFQENRQDRPGLSSSTASDEVEEFYDEHEYSLVFKTTYTMVCDGDLNANAEGKPGCISRYDIGVWNGRLDKMATTVETNNFFGSVWSRKKARRR